MLITCDDRDPPWMNEFVKSKIEWKNKIMLKMQIIRRTENAINDVPEIISKRKNYFNCHLASKLNNPKASAKAYWSILKSFYSMKKNTTHSSLTLITDFKQKANVLNNFFASHLQTAVLFQIFSHTRLIQDFHHYHFRMMIYLN